MHVRKNSFSQSDHLLQVNSVKDSHKKTLLLAHFHSNIPVYQCESILLCWNHEERAMGYWASVCDWGLRWIWDRIVCSTVSKGECALRNWKCCGEKLNLWVRVFNYCSLILYTFLTSQYNLRWPFFFFKCIIFDYIYKYQGFFPIILLILAAFTWSLLQK